MWQTVARTIAGQAEPECFPVPRLRALCPRNSDRLWLVASDVGGHCSLFFFYLHTLPLRHDHVRVVGTWVGLASHLCDMWGPLSDLQGVLAFSNGAAVSQCACLTTPRPVGPPCELPANLVRLVDPMISSNPLSMAATLAHTCRPLVIDVYTRRPPHTNTAGRSVPVSECRLLVFTTLTEGAVLGGGCDVNGDSAYAVSSQGGATCWAGR